MNQTRDGKGQHNYSGGPLRRSRARPTLEITGAQEAFEAFSWCSWRSVVGTSSSTYLGTNLDTCEAPGFPTPLRGALPRVDMEDSNHSSWR